MSLGGAVPPALLPLSSTAYQSGVVLWFVGLQDAFGEGSLEALNLVG